jgi:hypothetical protein
MWDRKSASILDLGTTWMWVVSFTPRPLHPRGKSFRSHWREWSVGPRDGLDATENRYISCLWQKSKHTYLARQFRTDAFPARRVTPLILNATVAPSRPTAVGNQPTVILTHDHLYLITVLLLHCWLLLVKQTPQKGTAISKYRIVCHFNRFFLLFFSWISLYFGHNYVARLLASTTTVHACQN